MFVLEQSPTFKWDIKFQNLGSDGKVSEQTFKGIFKRSTREELLVLKKEAATRDLEDEISRLLVGWENITTADGTPIAYSTENKLKLLNIPGMVEALFFAYEDAISTGLRIKN